MAEIIDHIPDDPQRPILCCYVNATSRMQVARITNIKNWYFERVVFPGQRLVFEAVPAAQLEIHTGMMASSILSDTISCERLVINSEKKDPWELEIANKDSRIKQFQKKTQFLSNEYEEALNALERVVAGL